MRSSSNRLFLICLFLACFVLLGPPFSCLTKGALAASAVQVQRLSNGLTLILEENHTQPVIAVALCVNGGSRTETSEISGLSHYYEHLIYRGGSKEQAPLEFRRKMQELGDESGGYTSDDYTNYGFTVPKENFNEAFRRATDDWLDLVVTEEKIAAERQVVLEEYNQDDDRPDDQVYRRLIQLVYQRHPYRISPLGLRAAIEKANLQTFRTFYEERYLPNQMVLSMVGDFDAGAMSDLVAGTWGTRRYGQASFESGLSEPTQREFRFTEKKMQTETVKALLAFPIPPAAQADLPACDVAATLLGSGKSSRLWQALKIKSNLAVSVSNWVDRRLDPGFWTISLETQPDSLSGALAAATRSLTDLRDLPPTVDELNRACDQLLSRRERDLETFFARAEALGSAAILGSPFDVDRYPDLIRAVTRDDVSRVVRTYLRPDRGNLSIVIPNAAASFDPAPWTREWRDRWGEIGDDSPARSAVPPVRFQLGNGVTIVVQPRASATMVGAVALLRGGQWAEPRGKCGLANFTANLLDRGAGGMTQVQLADKLAAVGAGLTISGDHDYIGARLQVPSRKPGGALDLLAAILVSPTFPAEEIEKVRGDILASIRSLPDRPFENVNEAFYARLYKDSPYRLPVEGTEGSIRSITESDIRDFYGTNMVGANLTIAVVGPVDPQWIRTWAERQFGTLPRGRPVVISTEMEAARSAVQDTLVTRSQEQTTYNTGWPAVSVVHKDYLPLQVTARLLRERFFFKYVYEKGVAYRSWVYLTPRLGQGSIQNEMGVSPAVYADIARQVDDDFARFVREPIRATDLDAAKQKLISAHTLDAQTSIGLASELAFYELSGRGYEEYAKFPERIRAVTPERASEVARKYILPSRFTRVGVGDVK